MGEELRKDKSLNREHSKLKSDYERAVSDQKDAIKDLDKHEKQLAKAKKEEHLNQVQLAADALGMVDPTPVSDGISAAISLYRGDFVDAGLSVVSMLPWIGDALAKPVKGTRAYKRIAKIAKKIEDSTALVHKARKKIETLEKAAKAKKAALVKKRQELAERVRKKRAQKAREEKVAKGECPKGEWGTKLPADGRGKWKGEKGNSTWESEDGKYKIEYKNGYPDFESATYNGQKVTHPDGRVDIPDMKGTRGDFTAARDAMRSKTGNPNWPGEVDGKTIYGCEPDGYTWHHSENGTSMILVKSDMHHATAGSDIYAPVHTGGDSLSKEF